MSRKRVHDIGKVDLSQQILGADTNFFRRSAFSGEISGVDQPRPSRTRDLAQGREITALYLRELCQRVTNGSRHAMETRCQYLLHRISPVIKRNAPPAGSSV